MSLWPCVLLLDKDASGSWPALGWPRVLNGSPRFTGVSDIPTHVNSGEPCLEMWKVKYTPAKCFHQDFRKVDGVSYARWILPSPDGAVFRVHSWAGCCVPTVRWALDMLRGNREGRPGEQRHASICMMPTQRNRKPERLSTLLGCNFTNKVPFIIAGRLVNKPLTSPMKTHCWPWPCSSANCLVSIEIR